MTDIKIKTVADMRRAMAIPGVLVFMDRNDLLARDLQRNPARMEQMMRPRTVKATNTVDVIFENGDKGTHLRWPKATELRADGTNAFDYSMHRREGEPERFIRYRLEMPGTPGAQVPSKLPEAHPPLSSDEIETERTARDAAQAEQEAQRIRHVEESARLAARPRPEPDPRHAGLVAARRAAIGRALDKGLFYNVQVDQDVMEGIGDADYAVLEQLPTIVADRDDKARTPYVQEGHAAMEIAALPRGTWRMFTVKWPDGVGESTSVLMSTGAGTAHTTQRNFHLTAEDALADMRGTEIYHDRQIVEKERAAAKSARSLASRRFAVGQALGKLRINRQDFSSATIDAIDEATKSVSLQLRKRGSPKRYSCTLPAATLDQILPAAEAAGGTLV